MPALMNNIKSRHLVTALAVLASACALYVVVAFAPQHASGGQMVAADAPKASEFTPPSGGAPTFVDYPGYNSIGEMKRKAEAIIRGTVISAEKRDINISLESDRDENPEMATLWVSKVYIDRVIKGDLAEGQTIEVNQFITTEPIAMAEKSNQGLLFLALYPYGIPACPLNPTQGVVPITDGRVTPRAQDQVLPRGLTEDQFIARIKAAQ